MKNVFILLLSCFYCMLYGQQHDRDVLYYNDTLVRGEFRSFGEARLVFYSSAENKKIRIPYRAVDSLFVTTEEGKIRAHYKLFLASATGPPQVKVKNCLVRGPMSLYDSYSYGTLPIAPAGVGGFGGGFGSFGTPVSTYTMYLVRPGSTYAKKITITRRFKRKKFLPWAKEHFADCPNVLAAIAKITSIDVAKNLSHYVKLYNQHCAPKS